MAFGHWKSTSPVRATLSFGRWAWVMGLPLLVVVVPLVLFGGLELQFPLIMGWAMAGTLAWHAFFCRHRLVVDWDKGTLCHSIRSIYTIARMEVPLARLAGFCVTNSVTEVRGYDLMVVLTDGQRICLFKRGGLREMEERGQQLAEFCRVSYARECR
ncbi:hypothetical protein [Marinobacter zhejiangensis]|uniref:Uncharacterized protein n=1 Tax=Marinobacter zhejiangensis TaxID=488535 RepID=A0A1I4Q393_9GAMM|nr:hypothetical protein [Marinobacter zhejiangensis]SFM34568.1 hypothetical protein SAMN04487963_2156 [Marinobacter zhejiangensis]